MKYFISGHIDATREDFGRYAVEITHIIGCKNDKKCEFLVGDCDGIDKIAMNHIYSLFISLPKMLSYKPEAKLTIYHMNDKPRNTPVEKSVEELEKEGVKFVGGFKSDEERDAAMTRDSDFDIAFVKDNRWDSGTAKNIKRRHQYEYL